MNTMHETPIYVRFCETDAFGHTNNTSYFYYFEESRMRFLHDIQPLERGGDLGLVVARLTCDYMQQTYANDNLIARTSVEHIGAKSFTLRQEVLDSDSRNVVASGQCVLVCYDAKTQRSIAVPEPLRQKLEEQLHPVQ